MPAKRPPTDTKRAVAFGALVRQLRRQRGLSQRQLAAGVPMSGANLSRIELGTQGPPGEELVFALARGLDADPSTLLRAAGRTYSDSAFEDRVLAELDSLKNQINDGFSDLTSHYTRLETVLAKLAGRPER